MNNALRGAIAAAEAEGERLREEFFRADGPRGRGGSAPVDTEMEERLRAKLQALIPCAFGGEETGVTAAGGAGYQGWMWLVDPHDGTSDFLQGRRGSAVSIALLKDGVPVLGVVHSPLSPDRGHDTIAWAEGGPLTRNGRPIAVDLSRRRLEPGDFVWANASAALRPQSYASAVRPARFIAMPSIAYRLARVAAGDGAAAMTAHGVNEYDIAAGAALIRAANGVLLDAAGEGLVLKGEATRRVTGCFAGGPQAAAALARVDWKILDAEPRRERRVVPAFPRRDPGARLPRAAGCLLGQVVGDSLGAQVEFKSAAEIGRAFPHGVRDLGERGVFNTIAGQPTDDSEMALALARSIVKEGTYVPEAALSAYRDWLQTRPVDIGMTTERGLLGLHTSESESNGSLMRVSPIGIWAAGDPDRAANAARQDSALTHPNPVCLEACAGFAAAIAVGVGGGTRDAMLEAALAHSTSLARSAIEAGAAGERPASYENNIGWVLIALQNAFFQLARCSLEEALIDTAGRGGDTDTNAAIAGALLGACHGREAFPSRWVLPVLSCRPLVEAGALRPRPMAFWPDDLLELAEALLG